MNPEELYQWAIDRAQDALAGAERKTEKLREHLAATEAWLDKAQAKVAELEEQGLEGFLASLVDSGEATSDEVAPPAEPENKASGAVGAAAHDASVKIS